MKCATPQDEMPPHPRVDGQHGTLTVWSMQKACRIRSTTIPMHAVGIAPKPFFSLRNFTSHGPVCLEDLSSIVACLPTLGLDRGSSKSFRPLSLRLVLALGQALDLKLRSTTLFVRRGSPSLRRTCRCQRGQFTVHHLRSFRLEVSVSGWIFLSVYMGHWGGFNKYSK